VAQTIDEYSAEFWAWRVRSQPRSSDDILRVTRPPGWLPELGHAAVAAHREQRDAFEVALTATEARVHGDDSSTVADRVDVRLLRSALNRVTWELDVLRTWTQPSAYVEAALGPVFDVLLPPGVDAARLAEVARFLRNVPAVVAAAEEVLPGVAQAELADVAVSALEGIRERLDQVVSALARAVPDAPVLDELRAVAAAGADALERLRDVLLEMRPGLPRWQPVGRDAFNAFLRDVACIPMDADSLMAIGVREYQRASVLERLEAHRHRHRPAPHLPADVLSQVARHAEDETAVRAFLEAEGLLSQPATLRHYLNVPIPDYLTPLSFLGVTDDLTSLANPDGAATSYIPDPAPDLPYFDAANATDPRAGIVHEGVHAQQLALSWKHPRPVRRRYYDSAANEGIAFYNEEMTLAAALFDDAPHTRTVIYNFMRLRALRVQIDIGLATGAMSIAQARESLRTLIPVDEETADQEAVFFAQTPGQAMSYQIGKTQILALLADAAIARPELTLRELHDSLWLNGNVPIALQRWELLGLTDELDAIN
jgi:hypothetical protein